MDFSFGKIYPKFELPKGDIENPTCIEMKPEVLKSFKELFDEYVRIYGDKIQSSPNVAASGESSYQGVNENDMYDFDDEFEKSKRGKDKQDKLELDKYLNEECERGGADFDILRWWKVESQISRYFQDGSRLLAIPVSTVASEAAFSTGGRILDAFRSSLSPK